MLLKRRRSLSRIVHVFYVMVICSSLSVYLYNNYGNNDDVVLLKISNDGVRVPEEILKCQRFLHNEAIVKPNSRLVRFFNETTPVLISGAEGKQTIRLQNCAVPCFHLALESERKGKPDATFLKENSKGKSIFTIFRTMEAARTEVAINMNDIVMTTSLRSHVPVPYFSWVMHNFMKPVERRVTKPQHLASAVISNCNARNFRLSAISIFQTKYKDNFTIDFKGGCGGSKVVDKLGLIRKYKFHFAFENTILEDYVTEKFLEALIEGTVPVVIGAPNIQDFAPSANSFIRLNSTDDVDRVARLMIKLDKDDDAYSEMLRWKQEEPSNQFKALVDLSSVHSSCRLCIHVADRIRLKDECQIFGGYFCQEGRHFNDQAIVDILTSNSSNSSKQETGTRTCQCKVDSDLPENSPAFDIHLTQVRERGRFDFLEVYLDSRNLTINSLKDKIVETFQEITPPYHPIWAGERDWKGNQINNISPTSKIKLKIHRIYPFGASQRLALFGEASLDSDEKLRNFILRRPCGKLEVVFV